MDYQRLGALKSVEQFRDYLQSLNLTLSVDDKPLSALEGSPLAMPISLGTVQKRTLSNRWAVHPMEGWDGTTEGKPTDLTQRRWRHFGESGCQLIWGGEAFAVRKDGRANPNQLYYTPENIDPMRELLDVLKNAHQEKFGAASVNSMMIGLQLTHSGRYSRPNRKEVLESTIACHHAILDERTGIQANDGAPVITDAEVRKLIDDFVTSAKMAEKIGFDFVDVKHCHGYLGHEFLSAFDRKGNYGGDFEGRTRFLKEIVEGIRTEAPTLEIGCRLSLFDLLPFYPDPQGASDGKLGKGIPVPFLGNRYAAFGCDRDNPMMVDLSEPIRLLKWMRDELKLFAVNITAGSPYSTPHLQRPAYYPPSDGYQPPEDPLVGCVRQIEAVQQVKKAVPNLPFVGSAYSYFQEFLPHVGQAIVREEGVDFVGIGRLILSDWNLPAEILEGKANRSTKKICRTFSDCTTAPRNGILSGCFPLDERYKKSEMHEELKTVKKTLCDRLKSQEESEEKK